MTPRSSESFRASVRDPVRAAFLSAVALCLGGIMACSSSGASAEIAPSAGASSGGAASAGTSGMGPGASGTSPGASGQGVGGNGASASAGSASHGGQAGMSAGGSTSGAGSTSGGSTNGGVANGGAGAGGSSSAGAAGSAGGSGYRPCPTTGNPCKILPLGDSITWGIQYDGAYRVELFTKALAAQQKVTFTGSLSNGPNLVGSTAFPKNNEGHSGWTITQDAGLVPSPAFSTIPNIVLLMIGTNDIYAASGQATMPDRLGALMDKIVSAAPDALLVVAKITPLSNASWNNTIKTYNDAIPGLVQSRAAAGKHVMLADMNSGFMSSMLSSDGVHPNKSGYDFMGDAWYSVISGLLPK